MFTEPTAVKNHNFIPIAANHSTGKNLQTITLEDPNEKDINDILQIKLFLTTVLY